MQGSAWLTTRNMDRHTYHFSAPALHGTDAIAESLILSLIRCLQDRDDIQPGDDSFILRADEC